MSTPTTTAPTAAVPATTAQPIYDVEQHIALKRVTQITPAPDGSWLAVVVQRLDRDRLKYVSDLWKVPCDGSAAVQLTRGDSQDTAPSFRHDGALGFLSNRQPNEVKPDEDADKRMQVWLLPAAGGEPQQLTDEPLGVEAFKFAREANAMVLFAPVLADVPHDRQREVAAERQKQGSSARRYTRQPVRHWDHWLHENAERANTHLIVCQADASERRDLTPEVRRQLAIEPTLDISRDGKQVLCSWATVGSDRVEDSVVALFDVASGERRIVGHQPNGNCDSARFSPDGKTIATVRSARSPTEVMRPRLTLIDSASGQVRELASAWDRWPHLHDWSADGGYLLVSADDQGLLPAFLVDAQQGTVTALTDRSAGGTHTDLVWLGNESASSGAACIAGIRSTLTQPPEVFTQGVAISAVDATQAGQAGKSVNATKAPDTQLTPRQLTQFAALPADIHAHICSEHITVTSSDGVPVHCVITRPKQTQGKHPVLMWIHGGPLTMSGDGWHWRWNPLLAAAAGYIVVQPNPRGSTGFGQAFIQGIWRNRWGEQCYLDLMAVADALEKRDDVDATRLVAMGGSFGGYMTNWIGTQTQRFKCLVTHASIVTFAQFTGTTDHPPFWYLEMNGEDPYADAEHFERYAPIRYIKNWKTPALIIHGELDYRCPINEGLNLFEALLYHGVDAELMVFPDENHWISKPRNIVAWYQAVLGFVGKHLE